MLHSKPHFFFFFGEGGGATPVPPPIGTPIMEWASSLEENYWWYIMCNMSVFKGISQVSNSVCVYTCMRALVVKKCVTCEPQLCACVWGVAYEQGRKVYLSAMECFLVCGISLLPSNTTLADWLRKINYY